MYCYNALFFLEEQMLHLQACLQAKTSKHGTVDRSVRCWRVQGRVRNVQPTGAPGDVPPNREQGLERPKTQAAMVSVKRTASKLLAGFWPQSICPLTFLLPQRVSTKSSNLLKLYTCFCKFLNHGVPKIWYDDPNSLALLHKVIAATKDSGRH